MINPPFIPFFQRGKPIATKSLGHGRRSTTTANTGSYEGNNQESKKEEEKYLGNTGSARGNARKPKDAGNDRHNKEDQ